MREVATFFAGMAVGILVFIAGIIFWKTEGIR